MLFTSKKQPINASASLVLTTLKDSIKAKGTALGNNESTAEMLSGESFETGTQLKQVSDSIKTTLQKSGIVELLMQRNATEDQDHPSVINSLNHAAIVMAAFGDPAKYQSAFAANPKSEAGITVISQRVPGIDVTNISGETFEPQSIKDNLAISVMVSALATSVNSFEQLFYPTTVLPAGTNGVDITVRTPYAYQLKTRSNDGSKYLEKAERRSLIDAFRDNSILRSLANQVIAHAEANNSAVLVDAAIVPNRAVEVSGVTFNTRPLVFGKTIDLIDVSKVPELQGAGAQNQTDVLDSNVNLGELYITLTDSESVPVVATARLDVSSFPGTNFFPTVEGATSDQALNFDGVIQIQSDDLSVKAGPMSDLTIAGVTGKWILELAVSISGKLDESANIEAFANRVSIVRVLDENNAALGKSELDAVKAALTASLTGYHPKSARTNSNLRERGTIIDAGTPINYRIPVLPGSPLTAITPIGTSGEVSIRELANANRIRNSNNAVITTLEFERVIAKTRDLPANSTTVGSTLVTPTYLTSKLDVVNDLQRHSSMNGYADLRTGITNALSIMADQLAVKSGYLSALELESGSSENYDVILGSDPHLASLIMTSGDARALGAAHNFIVSKTHDIQMAGKIYMSFRRNDISGPNPLSYGFHAEMPALVYNAQLNYNGGTHQELQMIPRSRHAVTLPVLGVLSVTGLETLFSSPL